MGAQASVRVAAVSDMPLPGHLILSWLSPQDAADWEATGAVPAGAICGFVRNAEVCPIAGHELASGFKVTLAKPADPAATVAVAVLVRGPLWPALLDGTERLLGFDEHAANVTLHHSPSRPLTQPAANRAGDIRHVAVNLERNECRVAVYLPAGYSSHPLRRYRTIYSFPGLSGDSMARFHDDEFMRIVDEMDAIVIGFDTRTEYGSRYFSGRCDPWLSFLAEEVPRLIDEEFRTDRRPGSRVLIGQSTGGFNALVAAAHRPFHFGTVAIAAPDALDFEWWLLEPDGAIKEVWRRWMLLEHTVGGTGQMRSLACSWSPGGCEWPLDLETGQLRPSVLAAWLANNPMNLLRDLGSLNGRLWIGAGAADEFDLFEPCRRFSERATAMGVQHQFFADSGGHFDEHRLARLLALAMSQPVESTS